MRPVREQRTPRDHRPHPTTSNKPGTATPLGSPPPPAAQIPPDKSRSPRPDSTHVRPSTYPNPHPPPTDGRLNVPISLLSIDLPPAPPLPGLPTQHYPVPLPTRRHKTLIIPPAALATLSPSTPHRPTPQLIPPPPHPQQTTTQLLFRPATHAPHAPRPPSTLPARRAPRAHPHRAPPPRNPPIPHLPPAVFAIFLPRPYAAHYRHSRTPPVLRQTTAPSA